jgi:hypothetical protein
MRSRQFDLSIVHRLTRKAGDLVTPMVVALLAHRGHGCAPDARAVLLGGGVSDKHRGPHAARASLAMM